MLSVVLLITLKDISCVTCIENTCQRLLRKQIFAKKKRNLWLYSTSFMLMSPLPRIQHLLLPKIGEVGGTPRNTWQTFLLQQNYSFVSTLERRSVTKSLWTRLLIYCSKSQSWDLSGTCWWRNLGVRSQKEDSSFSLIRSYHCLSKYSPKPGFAIYSAQPQCFLHADHYCIPLLPYVSVRLICTLQYFTRLGLIPSLDFRDIDPLCCFTIKRVAGKYNPSLHFTPQ